MKAWISAFRLRTLPLALSSILMGSFLAAKDGFFRIDIFIMAAVTTILLQILSNLANDYGDSIHGADSAEREGPSRAVQSGEISSGQMKNAIIVFSLLSLISGVALIYISLKNTQDIFLFLGLGILAIIAAITYTAGKKPYGYAGLGDLSVMIFFGWVGVLGVYYLFANTINIDLLLPATSCGLLAVGVLNVNNFRDIDSDIKAGKKSVPVRIGRKKARIYHWFLLIGAWVCAIIYAGMYFTSPYQWLFVLSLPLFIKNGMAVSKYDKPKDLDPYLKQLALSTLLFVLIFGICVNLSL